MTQNKAFTCVREYANRTNILNARPQEAINGILWDYMKAAEVV